MFLKVFKEKSNQKFVDKTLSSRNVIVNRTKVVSAGILLNDSEYFNYEEINAFLDEIGIASTKRKFFTFSKSKETTHNNWDNIFKPTDFGWRGKLKHKDLFYFTETPFDVLICYFLAEDNELKQIAAMSNANFKVGISNEDDRLYDLIIDINTKNFEIFTKELKKYLTILNKI